MCVLVETDVLCELTIVWTAKLVKICMLEDEIDNVFVEVSCPFGRSSLVDFPLVVWQVRDAPFVRRGLSRRE